MGEGRRFFTRRETWAAFARQGKVCIGCEREVPFDLMQGDHVVPYSEGGTTTLDNCQALCGACNARKGAKVEPAPRRTVSTDALRAGDGLLRDWQREALPRVLERIADEPVLINATPGAGKTRFGLEVAYERLAAGAVTRVLVVTHTVGIRSGWRDSASYYDAAAPHVPFADGSWRPYQPIPEGRIGCVTTYQAIASSPIMFSAHASDPGHRTLLVLDEVHHLSEENVWAEQIGAAFEGLDVEVLALSGTPFRSDGAAIPFISYDGRGAAIALAEYGMAAALTEGVCRPVRFVFHEGDAEFEGEATVTKLRAQGSPPNSQAFRSLLFDTDPSGLAADVLRSSSDYVESLRSDGDRDAACLVAATTTQHADAVAKLIEDIDPGSGISIAHSNLDNLMGPGAHRVIDDFRNSDTKWLVSVNMVSEGVDIRRLRCLAWLTNRLTELSFRQLVGRIVRSQLENDHDSGAVFLPAHSELWGFAETFVGEAGALLTPPELTTSHSRRAEFDRTTPTELKVESWAALETSGPTADDLELVEACRRFIESRGLASSPEALAAMASANDQLRQQIEGE